MNIIFQGRFPVRTIVLIGVALLITTQIYAQNAEARLSLTLRNATLKEFVKQIENSTGYSFIYGEEIIIKHKINLQVKDKPLREILDLVFKNEQISYQFTGRHILLQKKKESKTVGRKFTISGYVTVGTSSETLIGPISLRVIRIKEQPPILTVFTASLCPKEKPNCVSPIWVMPQKRIILRSHKIHC